MFIDFLFSLRRRGVPVGTQEWLAFHQALREGMIQTSEYLRLSLKELKGLEFSRPVKSQNLENDRPSFVHPSRPPRLAEPALSERILDLVCGFEALNDHSLGKLTRHVCILLDATPTRREAPPGE